jgi:hypothetical protein
MPDLPESVVTRALPHLFRDVSLQPLGDIDHAPLRRLQEITPLFEDETPDALILRCLRRSNRTQVLEVQGRDNVWIVKTFRAIEHFEQELLVAQMFARHLSFCRAKYWDAELNTIVYPKYEVLRQWPRMSDLGKHLARIHTAASTLPPTIRAIARSLSTPVTKDDKIRVISQQVEDDHESSPPIFPIAVMDLKVDHLAQADERLIQLDLESIQLGASGLFDLYGLRHELNEVDFGTMLAAYCATCRTTGYGWTCETDIYHGLEVLAWHART